MLADREGVEVSEADIDEWIAKADGHHGLAHEGEDIRVVVMSAHPGRITMRPYIG